MTADQKTYAVEAYGCQMNIYDGGLIAAILERAGYRPADEMARADLMVVNTCSVRDHAEQRALGRIRELAGLRKHRPGTRLVICGCMAQRMGTELLDCIPGIDLVAGTGQYRRLPELLRRIERGRAADVAESRELYSDIRPRTVPELSAFVSVMRGCDNRCAYCIVPRLRGPARSRSMNEILDEVRSLTGKGVRQITLLGQNVNAYRDGAGRFADLLRRADRVENLWRIRFTTSHPRDMSDDILAAMAECGSVCEHLHLPLQSGSDRILKAMRRGYTAAQYHSVVERARELIPGLSITTDLIAGFPGETEDDFQRTLEMMQAVEFDAAFTFQYSPRPGTDAVGFSGQVPDEVRHERLERLIDHQLEITRQINQRMVGQTVEVLVEGPSKRDEAELMGRTRTNKGVIFAGDARLAGRLVAVHVRTVRTATARGELAAEPSSRPVLP
jgi:tRNA-2-methylthio-N6-dimethylallyladenosine synthase